MTEVKGFLSLSRRLALSGLKGSFLLISLKTPSVIYFQNPLSNCDSVRSLPSTLRRITLPSLEMSFYLISKCYFLSLLSICDIVRGLTSSLGRVMLCEWVLLDVF